MKNGWIDCYCKVYNSFTLLQTISFIYFVLDTKVHIKYLELDDLGAYSGGATSTKLPYHPSQEQFEVVFAHVSIVPENNSPIYTPNRQEMVDNYLTR